MVVRSQTGLTASQWTVSPALAFGTTYYWRVRAASACTTGAWTVSWNFMTQPPPSYTLTVTKNEAIGGRVTSSPPGIDCGTTCSASFADGTTVALTATPADGWQFGSWTGCDMTNGNQCTVTMAASGDRTVWANFTTCPGKPWSWGAYDWLSCPALTLTDISNVVTDMAGHGFRGFRTFINSYFGPYPQCNTGSPRDTVGRQPYAFDTSTQKFNLLYWDEASAGPNDLSYWERVRAAVEKMAQAGFRKILITLGHVYSPSPWLQDHNINKYGDFGAQVPSCQGNTTPINIGGAWIANWGSLNQCQKDWIKAEYQRLAQKFMAVAEQAVPGGSQLLVFEIFNEADPTTWPAHQELVQALVQAGVPAARIQVNIDAPLNGPCGCPNFDDTSFTTAWNNLIGSVGSWAVHSLWPKCLTDCYSSSSFFWTTMWTSGKLELSTDGQFCNTGPTAPCCPCCHIQAGELLDAAIQQAGGDAKNLPFAFEHDTGLVRTDLPSANGIAWQAWELSEVECLFRRHCQGIDCPGPTAGDVKGRVGNLWADGPLTVSAGDSVQVFWDTTFRNSQNPYACSVSGVGGGTFGCSSVTAGCGTTTVALYCNNTLMDTLELRTCGNGVCDTQCETPDNCALDCVQPPPEPRVTLTVNGSSASPVPVWGTLAETYRVDWTSDNATACTLTRNGWDTVSTALNGSLDWPIGNVCDTAADCDLGERCVTQAGVYYDETWVLTCSNPSWPPVSATVTARVHYRFCM